MPITAVVSAAGVTWFVEGRGQGAGTTVGWGEGHPALCLCRLDD